MGQPLIIVDYGRIHIPDSLKHLAASEMNSPYIKYASILYAAFSTFLSIYRTSLLFVTS